MKPIQLALLLPMSGKWAGGLKIAGAAALAVARVNSDDTLLHGFALKYSWRDSGCSASQGLKAMGKLSFEIGTINAVIGPGCSTACEPTSQLTAGPSSLLVPG